MADYMEYGVLAAQRDAAFDEVASKDAPLQRLYAKGAMGASVFMFAYVNGRYKNPKIAGAVPVDLAMAVGLTVGHAVLDYAMPGAVPSMVATAVDAVSSGALASYIAKLGTGFGYEAAKEAKEPWAQSTNPLAAGYESSSSSFGSSSSGYEGTYGTLPGAHVGALSADEASIYVR